MGTRTKVTAIGAALLMTACFSMEHRLPPRAYFGRLPARAGEQTRSFTEEAMKPYLLCGLFPYSALSSGGLLMRQMGTERVENLTVETEFTWLDTVLWVIPGQTYGYYFFAPRSIRVSGTAVQSGN